MNEDIRYLIWLIQRGGAANVRTDRVYSSFVSPKEAYLAGKAQYSQIEGLDKEDIELFCDKNLEAADRCIVMCRSMGIKIIGRRDSGFPKRLIDVTPKVLALFTIGDIPPETDELSISIVGTRNMTPYGGKCSERFGSELAGYGFTVVSGMADGIDCAAQAAAFDRGAKCVAVLGSSPDIPYPKASAGLYHRLCESGRAAVISEYPPVTRPFASNFPRRNRIICGLTPGTLVIEAKEKSGSMITARLALEQKKDLFAIPGNITSELSSGTNLLIREGAIPVFTPEDIVRHYSGRYNIVREAQNKLPAAVVTDKKHKAVLDVLTDSPVHLSVLSAKAGISEVDLKSCLTVLEIMGLAASYAGECYSLK